MKLRSGAVITVVAAITFAAPAGAAVSPEAAKLAAEASMLDQRGDPLGALELSRQARELAPREPALAVLQARLLARVGSVKEAIATFEEARKLGSTDPSAWVLPATLLRDAARPEEAIELLKDALAQDHRSAATHEQLVFLLLEKGDFLHARAIAEAGRADWPDEVGLKLALGLALARVAESRDRAVELLEEALREGAPEPAKVHLELGTVLLDMGRNEAAIPHLTEAIRLAPDTPESHYRLATALRASGDLDGATKEMSAFQELSRQRDAHEWREKELGTRLNEAQELATANRLAEALEKLDALIREAPELVPAYGLRAKVLFSLGRREPALEDIRRAHQLSPGVAEYPYLEGYFLVALGRTEEAAVALGQAVALNPDEAAAHELLGKVLDDLGRTSEAVQHYRRAQELGSQSPALAANLEAALGRLKSSPAEPPP